MPPSLLRDLFRRALKASVVAPLAIAGCGPNVAGYQAPQCVNGSLAVSGLSPAVIPDVVELRSRTTFRGSDPASVGTLSTSGTACATAADKPTCQAAFDGLNPDAGFGESCLEICVSYFLGTTRADEVKAWSSIEELKTFLGTIDTEQEAALMAHAHSYRVQCEPLDRGGVKARSGGGYDVIAVRGHACGPGSKVTRYYLNVTPAGEVTETSSEVAEYGDPNCAIGRRPFGLASSGRTACDDALGRHFAVAAHLEAASVDAFTRLKEELALHGAPAALKGAAVLSAVEEVQHAHATSHLAERFGARVRPPRVEARPLRSLVDVALDNAVEGCVRETYGALVAHHQAAHAQDEEIRALMQRIADDETRHAELSWDIAAWAETKLAPSELAKVREAKRAAVAKLREELSAPVDPALVESAGMPDAASALAMLDVMLGGLPS
ncbi:MAG: ferritin-like domain-containing protein [Myxococcales bacterium]|nr:ferritin-like domain-containing protein [Myxococcales bacterium]